MAGNTNIKNNTEGKPRWYTRYGLQVFTFLSCVLLFASRFLTAHTTASARMVEKQFGLTGTQTTWLLTADNITSLVSLILFGYIGGKYNKARFFAILGMLLGFSHLLFSLPYYISLKDDDVMKIKPDEVKYSNQTNLKRKLDIICKPLSNRNDTCSALDESEKESSSDMFYIILLLARLLVGMFKEPHLNLPYIYINENCGTRKTVLYTGKKSKFVYYFFWFEQVLHNDS